MRSFDETNLVNLGTGSTRPRRKVRMVRIEEIRRYEKPKPVPKLTLLGRIIRIIRTLWHRL